MTITIINIVIIIKLVILIINIPNNFINNSHKFISLINYNFQAYQIIKDLICNNIYNLIILISNNLFHTLHKKYHININFFHLIPSISCKQHRNCNLNKILLLIKKIIY